MAERANEYTTTSFQGNSDSWRTHGDQIISVFESACSDFLSKSRVNDESRRLKRHLSSHKTNAVLLQDKENDETVGFTYMYPASNEYFLMKRRAKKFGLTKKRTAIVGWTAIRPDHRSQGGYSVMMGELEKQMTTNGQFDGMLRFVRTANNYSEKVRKRHEENIVYERTAHTAYGEQKYYVVKFSQPL